MADVFSKRKRSEVMSRIRGTNTKPELRVRSILHRMGYRFRVNVATLPGRPDIVLPRFRTVVLVHGCFWHRHSDCRFATIPKTRTDFWSAKFSGNISRDKVKQRELRRLGWRVLTIWECELRNLGALARRISRGIGASKTRGRG